MKKIKNVLRHWKKFFIIFLLLIISHQSWKIGYLEKQKVLVYQDEFDDNNTDSKSGQDSSYESSGDDTSEIVLELENKNEELKQEIEALRNIKKDKSSEVLSDIFWDIGKYVPKDDNATFFISPSCEGKVKPEFFISKRWIFYDRDNGYDVYTYRSSVGYVYATEEIDFEKFKVKKN